MPEADSAGRSGLTEELDLIRSAGREAGAIAMRYFKRSPEVWLKGGHSPVSEADYAVDRYLRETLVAARPGYGWLSEETVDSPARLGARRTFVVDPIDGTRAFLEGRSTWCVSIAVVENGRTLAGVIDCPAKDEIFWAVRGGGAWKNGAPLPPAAANADHPLIAGPKPLVDRAADLLGGEVRRSPYVPSLAYRVAMVASNALDATFVKPGAHDWDIAAADLILAEAGGRILDNGGSVLRYAGAEVRRQELVAGSGALLDRLAAIIAVAET